MILRIAITAGLLVVATSSRSGEPRTIGPDRCATCHQQQHATHVVHAHARAYARLPVAQQKNRLCTTCHAPDPQRPEVGVSCEACHGAGSEYSAEHVMRDPNLRGFLGLVQVDLARCKVCHQTDHSTKLLPVDIAKLFQQFHHRSAAAKPEAAPGPAGP